MAERVVGVRAAEQFIVMRERPGLLRRMGHLARRKPLGAWATGVLVFMWLVAIFGPFITKGPIDIGFLPLYDPFRSFVEGSTRLEAPNSSHWFGTDSLGRDIFSRVLYATRLSMVISLSATVLGIAGGMTVGIISGYFMGWFDLLWQRVVDAFQAMPTLVLLMVVVFVLDANLFEVAVVIAVITIPAGGRLVRSMTMSIRENQYIEAARALGASNPRIISRHVYPNVLPVVIVLAATSLGGNLLLQSALSFLGLVSSETPDWGSMLNQGARRYIEAQPWLAIAPGVAISMTVLAYNLLGDTLRDILDPRLRGSD